MLTGYQLAAARALIGMDQMALARLAKVGAEAIRGMEEAKVGSIGARQDVAAVRAALEAQGVEFLIDGGPGVRLRQAPAGAAAIAVENLTSANDE